eukprot:366465-Chlamydomonas_euryale.AAC.14
MQNKACNSQALQQPFSEQEPRCGSRSPFRAAVDQPLAAHVPHHIPMAPIAGRATSNPQRSILLLPPCPQLARTASTATSRCAPLPLSPTADAH